MAESLAVSKAQSGYLILYPLGVLIVLSSARLIWCRIHRNVLFLYYIIYRIAGDRRWSHGHACVTPVLSASDLSIDKKNWWYN